MRVYKFLSCKYGLRALRERRLKIAEIRGLNDPFDLLPFDLSDPILREAVMRSKEQIGEKSGLMCFSASWHNPVLWSHYTEHHRGLCLGFDVAHEECNAVDYVDKPLLGFVLNFDWAKKMLFTKYTHWQYEDEVRMWSSLETKSGKFYFHDFNEHLVLAEVIIGAGCQVSRRRLIEALGRNGEGVRVFKVRGAYNAFRMVEDEAGY